MLCRNLLDCTCLWSSQLMSGMFPEHIAVLPGFCQFDFGLGVCHVSILQDLLLWHLDLLARYSRPCREMRFDALHHCYKGIASPAFHPSCLTFQGTHILQTFPLNFCISCIGMTWQLNRPLTGTLPTHWVSTNNCCVLPPPSTALSIPVLPLSYRGQRWFIVVWIGNEGHCILALIIEAPGLF